MKTRVSGIGPGLGFAALLACGASTADAITEQTTSQRTYPVSSTSPRLIVRNIWGNVTVRAGAAREINVTVNEHRTAPTQALFEQSKQRLVLTVEANTDGVSL